MKRVAVAALMCISAGAAQANCLGSGALSPSELSRFNANPVAYFIGMSTGQQQSAVRQLAASDPATAARIMSAYGGAPMAQQSAIAAGLGEAARACQAVDPDQARQIQTAAVAIDGPLRLVFDRSTGQAQVGATGGGGAGGGGGGGAGGGGGGGSSGGGLNQTTAGGAQNAGFSGPSSFSRSNSPTSSDVGSSSGRTTTNTSTATSGVGAGNFAAVQNSGPTGVQVPTPTSP